jgi:hypothetical protein
MREGAPAWMPAPPSARAIDRPEVVCDDEHRYTLDGERVVGVSTVAKVVQNPAPLIAWAFKLGREGEPHQTPWNTRQQAADRGNAVHDALERLAQDDRVPNPADYPPEERGHVESLLRWYLWARPEFEAVEVVVGSRKHRFAGRYDIRCRIPWAKLGVPVGGVGPQTVGMEPLGPGARALVMVDLKTSKGVYPDSHFPQLAGYEIASVEMGFAPTDAQYVLRTSPDGAFKLEPDDAARDLGQFVRSWATPDTFLAYLDVYRAVEALKADDPREAAREARRREREVRAQANADLEGAILAVLPATSREVAEALDIPQREAATRLQALKGRGEAEYAHRRWMPRQASVAV